ncbi:hypothetical protein MESS4_270043 [Mesorhizobium sp. STM 4661]|nr:hypothetical protein MESS4_270043 [Mesorhizobium sp. STM 4661]
MGVLICLFLAGVGVVICAAGIRLYRNEVRFSRETLPVNVLVTGLVENQDGEGSTFSPMFETTASSQDETARQPMDLALPSTQKVSDPVASSSLRLGGLRVLARVEHPEAWLYCLRSLELYLQFSRCLAYRKSCQRWVFPFATLTCRPWWATRFVIAECTFGTKTSGRPVSAFHPCRIFGTGCATTATGQGLP